MPRLRKASLTGLALILAITLALLSANIERVGPEMAAYGDLCGPSASEPCYKPVLNGGFPMAYLYDAPGISREHQLAFGEDKLFIGALIFDIAFYFTLGLVAFRFAVRRRQR